MLLFIENFGQLVMLIGLNLSNKDEYDVMRIVLMHICFCLSFGSFWFLKNYVHPQLSLTCQREIQVEVPATECNKNEEKETTENEEDKPPTYSQIFIGEN